MDFDKDRIVQQAIEAGQEQMRRALEAARAEMGPEGEGIVITPTPPPHHGDKPAQFNIACPTPEARERLFALARAKMPPGAV